MESATNKPEGFDCVVIGAGMAGLIAADTLVSAGRRVCVLDKGRGLGGRMATRRKDGAVFDHGAQFFTVRDARFRPRVDAWLRLGIAAPWYVLGKSGMHFRGEPGMTAIAKHLADGLDVRRALAADKVGFQDGIWTVFVGGRPAFQSAQLVISAPLPQALALLDAGKVPLPARERAALEKIRYQRCIAALAILDRASAITSHAGARKLDGEPIQWIADNQRKGISPDVPAVTIHSTPAFAEAHWDTADAIRIPRLIAAAAPHLGAKVLSYQGHRWGFSQPVDRYHADAFVEPTRGLAIAGDGLAGGRVEGAFLSGLVAGQALAAAKRPATTDTH